MMHVIINVMDVLLLFIEDIVALDFGIATRNMYTVGIWVVPMILVWRIIIHSRLVA